MTRQSASFNTVCPRCDAPFTVYLHVTFNAGPGLPWHPEAVDHEQECACPLTDAQIDAIYDAAVESY